MATNQDPNIVCSNQATFDLCIGNWQSGGTTSICSGQVNGSKAQNICLCGQYFNQAYCYNSFCPQDQTTAQLNSLRASYCQLVPDFDPTLNKGLPAVTNQPGASAIAPATSGGVVAPTANAGSSNTGPVLTIPGSAGGLPTLTALPKNSGGVVGAVDATTATMCLISVLVALF
ncbi:hypothetical protein HDU99_002736 [Rhizoclosmatium hyalinum]|nr:hypothetical protein HDU99_002736 [Rhizoclosmatium hyalinum]